MKVVTDASVTVGALVDAYPSTQDCCIDDRGDRRCIQLPARLVACLDQRAFRASTVLVRPDPALPVLGALRLPSGSVSRVIEHAEMFPVEGHAARVIRDREVRVSDATIGQHEPLLVCVVDVARVKLVGNHQLGLRPYEVATLCSMNEPFLEETLLGVDGYLARLGLHKEVRHAPGDLRVLVTRNVAVVDKRPLVQDDESVLVPGQRRVQELTGEQPAGVGQDHEGDAELAALGLVHRQAVRQLERVTAFVSELPGAEPIFVAQLAGELDLELPRQALELLRLVLPDDDANVALAR